MWTRGRLWMVVAVAVGYLLVAAVPGKVADLAAPQAAEEAFATLEAQGGEEPGIRGGELAEAPLRVEAGQGVWGLVPLFALDLAVALLVYLAARRVVG